MIKNYSLLLLAGSLAFGQSTQLTGQSALAVNEVVPFTSAIAFQGVAETQAFYGEAEYEVFPDTQDGILDKPIILVDGFDPSDSRNTSMIYQMLNYGGGQNLADDLRAQGFDIIILNFPNYTRATDGAQIAGGADYIQRNAMNLVELLETVNAAKVGDEKNVVIGPSMGGLISRYALRYMEMNGMEHDTRLYLSFDSPHKGANFPIGFQHLFNYMANGPLGDPTLAEMIDTMLKSPASNQMLIDHLDGHLAAGDAVEFNPAITLPTGKPAFRNAFQSELDAMGFPQTTRNVAISNGSGSDAANGTPGQVVMNHTFYMDASTRGIVNLNFTPYAGQTSQVSRFRGEINLVFFWLTIYDSAASSQAPAASDGLDAGPGGRFNFSSLADEAAGSGMMEEFFNNLQISYFNFIPTFSSLAVENVTNWHMTVDASQTPFDAVYIPAENENHVTLTPENVAFALSEILVPLGINKNELKGIVVRNPFGNSFDIYSGTTLPNTSITVVDMLGKTVFEQHGLTLDGVVSIPVELNSGMYFMTIENGGKSVVKKIVK